MSWPLGRSGAFSAKFDRRSKAFRRINDVGAAVSVFVLY